MGKVIERVPIPMAGLMLALAALGNLLSPYGSTYKYFWGVWQPLYFFS